MTRADEDRHTDAIADALGGDGGKARVWAALDAAAADDAAWARGMATGIAIGASDDKEGQHMADTMQAWLDTEP